MLIITHVYIVTRTTIIYGKCDLKYCFTFTFTYKLYKCYTSGVTFRIPEGFLKISVRVINKYLIYMYYFDSSWSDYIDYITTNASDNLLN
jgi:hypothetical protein